MHKAKGSRLKESTDNSTIIIEDFNISFLIIDRTSRWKFSSEIDDLN